MTALYNEFDPYTAEWLRNLIAAGELPAGRVDERSIAELTGADIEGIDDVHFFAGVGGWPLALRLAGWTGPVWTGSAPCQPFSSAGKRKGTADERHLWPEMLRLIKECRPPIVFGEQVASSEVVGTQLEAAFIVAVQDGDFARANKLAKRLAQSDSLHFWVRWIDRLQADMASAGYSVRFKVLGAHSVQADHIRQRLFWVADASTDMGLGGIDEPERGSEGRTANRRAGAGARGVANAGRQQRERRPHESRPGGDGSAGSVRGGTGTDGERSPWSNSIVIPCRDGKHRRISAQPGDEPLVYGIPRSLGPAFAGLGAVGIRAARRNRVGRLKGYGNAIVPQVAAEFVRAFMESTGRGTESWTTDPDATESRSSARSAGRQDTEAA